MIGRRGYGVRMHQRPGYTLPELALVLVIIGTVAGPPTVRAPPLLDRAGTRAAAGEVTSLPATARDLAVAESRRVTFRLDEGAASVAVRAGADTLARRALGAVHGVRLATTRDSILYSPIGTGYGAANARIVLTRGAAA